MREGGNSTKPNLLSLSLSLSLSLWVFFWGRELEISFVALEVDYDLSFCLRVAVPLRWWKLPLRPWVLFTFFFVATFSRDDKVVKE